MKHQVVFTSFIHCFNNSIDNNDNDLDHLHLLSPKTVPAQGKDPI